MAQEFWPWDQKDIQVIHMSLHTNDRSHYNSVRSTKDPMRKGVPAVKYTSIKGFEYLTGAEKETKVVEEDKEEAQKQELQTGNEANQD